MASSTQMSENILDGYRQNAQKTDKIIYKIQKVGEMSLQNEESIDAVTQASEQIHKAADELDNKLRVFKV
jgi:methyl-accepting chemotaxis protein